MRITFAFIMVFLLAGCAAKDLAVKNADNLLTHQITKRIPLYSDQKDQLEKDIDNFLNKTKPKAEEILPVIDEVTLNDPEKIESQYNSLERFYARLATDFSEILSKYMAKLDPKQQKDLFENLDDENVEIKKREKGKTIEKVEERVEMVLGSINSKQKALISEYKDYFLKRHKDRLERRLKLQGELRNIYKNETSPDSKKIAIQEAFSKYQTEAVKGNKNVEILKKLAPTITKDQRENLRKQIQEVKGFLKYYMTVEY